MFIGLKLNLNQLLIDLNLFSFTLPKPYSPTTADICYYAIALLMFASLLYSISSKKRKDLTTYDHHHHHVDTGIPDAAAGLFQRSHDDDELSWKSATDALFHEDNDEIVSEDDAKYAEELQVQEALLASMFSSQTTNNASSSTHQARTSLGSWLKNKEMETADLPLNTCKICLESHESWKMFRNSTCSHSFCYECTSKHATTKIQENNNTIKCPALNCDSTLDFNAVRLIVPKDVLIKWDETLCESMILESHKLYCPFANCSVLLVNDDVGITKIDCPVCKRAFCAVCRVPWHSEFSCKEFEKLNSKKKGKKDDEMTVALAKKKKWKKCPKCKFFVEKAEGCLHITCRCKYEFCYNCRSKWTSNHGVGEKKRRYSDDKWTSSKACLKVDYLKDGGHYVPDYGDHTNIFHASSLNVGSITQSHIMQSPMRVDIEEEWTLPEMYFLNTSVMAKSRFALFCLDEIARLNYKEFGDTISFDVIAK
ncbi:hypothetical protein OSB04_003814 [Centaurea solstitialis]|uniref:RBR-type E3 ubiquitin transferase n=1 Tax=Centaurea solstitialis TaxID=347529 RepID=A0AA38UD18_9ASTR|nr:hypothetical protein OSB04_003814 [Centaurea solstitialis]